MFEIFLNSSRGRDVATLYKGCKTNHENTLLLYIENCVLFFEFGGRVQASRCILITRSMSLLGWIEFNLYPYDVEAPSPILVGSCDY